MMNLKSLEVEKEHRDFNISRCKNRLKEHSHILKGLVEYFMTINGIVSLPLAKVGKEVNRSYIIAVLLYVHSPASIKIDGDFIYITYIV